MDWKRNLNNYWLNKINKKENVSYEAKIHQAWKDCIDYVENFKDDKNNFDMAFFKELLGNYIEECLPDIEELRCKELVENCLDICKYIKFF